MTDARLRLYIAKRIRGLLAGDHASYHLSTKGHDLQEKRKFRLGDDPGSINLLATAKRGGEEPWVAINRIEKGANVVFLIDCSQSTRFGTIVEKYQYVLDFTHQVSVACVGSGNRLRFIAFDEKIRYISNFTVAAGAAEEFLCDLSRLPARRGKTNLKKVLAEFLDINGQFSLNVPGIVFIVSDFLFESDFGQQLARVGELSDLIAVVLRDPAELSLPRPRLGFVRLTDPETGQNFFARKTVSPLDRVMPVLKRCEVDCMEVNTGKDLGMALKNLMALFEKKREG